MSTVEQVYQRPLSNDRPDEGDITRVMHLAATKPGSRFEMPWIDQTATKFKLSVRFLADGNPPTWVYGRIEEEKFVLIWSMESAITSEVVAALERDNIASTQSSRESRAKAAKAAIRELRNISPEATDQRITGQFGFQPQARPTAANGRTSPAHVVDQRVTGEYGAHSDRPSIRLNSNIRLGDLLQRAQLVTASQIEEALPLSRKTGLPIGRILIEAGNISEQVLRATVVAQSLIRDGMLHPETAVLAIAAVSESNETLEIALKKLGWRSQYYQTTNKLGNLLYDAGCITKAQLSQALEVCFASGLPLGRVLVLRKVVPEIVAYAALSAQILLREGKIPRSEALAAVRLATTMKTTIQGWLEHGGLVPDGKSNVVRLGELLILAGVVTELDLLSSVERGLLEEKPIGQVLIGEGLINDAMLKTALDLQNRVNFGKMGPFEAASTLSRLYAEDANLVGEITLSGESKDNGKAATRGSLTGYDDPKALLQELLIQKQNLAYKVVSQHEEVKHRLARELHDTIIADLLMLRRYLSGDRALTNEQIIEIVDDVVHQLREICNDFAPRQLHEWGLEMTLQDLAERMNHRSGIECSYHCSGKPPNLPEPVQLHMFRIVQESLNNIEKYAGASKVLIKIEVNTGVLRITIADNGKGFVVNETRDQGPESGGMGMQSMRERIELIRCYFPTTLSVHSDPGQGSSVIIELTI